MKMLLILILFCIFIVSGCTTYYVSTQNFLEQFDSSGIQNRGFLFPNAIKGNNLDSLTCFDKKGNKHTIPVTPHTAIRITKTDNKRTQIYFDTIILKDSTITGSKSHFIKMTIDPIKFSEIAKIEIQK